MGDPSYTNPMEPRQRQRYQGSGEREDAQTQLEEVKNVHKEKMPNLPTEVWLLVASSCGYSEQHALCTLGLLSRITRLPFTPWHVETHKSHYNRRPVSTCQVILSSAVTVYKRWSPWYHTVVYGTVQRGTESYVRIQRGGRLRFVHDPDYHSDSDIDLKGGGWDNYTDEYRTRDSSDDSDASPTLG